MYADNLPGAHLRRDEYGGGAGRAPPASGRSSPLGLGLFQRRKKRLFAVLSVSFGTAHLIFWLEITALGLAVG